MRQPITALPPPHPPGMWPQCNIAPWPPEYTVQIVCKWAVAVCVWGLSRGAIQNFEIAMTLSLSNSFVMTKRPFSNSPWYNRTGWLGVKHQLTYLLTYLPFPNSILLFQQFNVLQLSISVCLKRILAVGYWGRKNTISSVRNRELTNIPLNSMEYVRI